MPVIEAYDKFAFAMPCGLFYSTNAVHSVNDWRCAFANKSNDLFHEIVSPDKLDPRFSLIKSRPSSAPGRALLSKEFSEFVDADGNFVEQFQTTGFGQRIWELYLNSFFKEAGFSIDKSFDRPDFILEKNGITISVEAVTTGESQNPSFESIIDKDFPIRFSRVLRKKLGMEYWNLPHVQGKPFCIAVAPFHSKSPVRCTDSGLCDYLYGRTQTWSHNELGNLSIETKDIDLHQGPNLKTIKSGFFKLPESQNISAVIFSNAGTFPKFNRLGHQDQPNDDLLLVRVGACYNSDPNAAMPHGFLYQVGDRRFLRESWGQGIVIHHNPNASHPLPKSLFGNAVCQNFGTPQGYSAEMPIFHPYGSVTMTLHGKTLNTVAIPPMVTDQSVVDEVVEKLHKVFFKDYS